MRDPTPISGEVQFWRLDTELWAPTLDAVADAGITHVATYLSWRRHEQSRGDLDFTSPRLDVRFFLELCGQRGIGVHLKPGPWICAEEVGGGLPDWVLTQTQLLAQDFTDATVVGYNPPFRHPVPSYASPEFRSLAAEWYAAVWDAVTDYATPGGVIEAFQLDNEPSAAFQDAMYRFDYSPAAQQQFREFTLALHGSAEQVAKAWGETPGSVEQMTPPRPPSGVEPTRREQDWIAFHEHYISDYLAFLHRTLTGLGGGHLTATVNLNTHPVRGLPQSGKHIVDTLRAAQPEATIVAGEDHYFEPPLDPTDLAQLELGAALGIHSGSDLVWAPELQAGIWRSPGEDVTYPDPRHGELAAWWGLALAYGYQGFNLYMLVDRENWQYAPITSHGRPTEGGHHLHHLMHALRQIPGLRGLTPRTAANLVWDRRTQERAYTVLGTQAHSIEPWTTEGATRPWCETLDLAQKLTARSVPYRLCATPDELDPRMPTYGPTGLTGEWAHVALTPVSTIDETHPPVRTTDPGVEARLLQAADGKQLLVLAAWKRERVDAHVTVETQDAFTGPLTDPVTGAVIPVRGRRAHVDMPDLGVRILMMRHATEPPRNLGTPGGGS